MEANESDSTTTSSIIAIVVAVPVLLIMLCFAAPVPLWMFLCSVCDVEDGVFIAPVAWLCDRSELYEEYVIWQGRLFGIY